MATVEELNKELFYKAPNAGAVLCDDEINKADVFAEGYKKFLNEAKTEREATAVVLAQAKEKGFQEFVKLEQEAKAQSQKDYEEKLEQQKIIQKAKEEGKKIEMILQDGKLKPIIVGDKTN